MSFAARRWARVGLSAEQADTLEQIVRCPGCGAWDLEERLTQKRGCRHVPRAAIPVPGGIERRLRALAAIGWGAGELAPLLGVDRRTVERHLHQGGVASAATQAAVEDLYERLCMTVGPSRLAAARARSYNWAPPLAWDEDAIDVPTAAPDGQAPAVGERNGVPAAERVEDITWCVEQGMTAQQAAWRLGIQPCTVRNILRRAGAGDVIDQLRRNGIRREIA